MENAPLNQRFKAFCENLSLNDTAGERDELLEALKLYAQLSPADMYASMIEAHSKLFGGSVKGLRYGIDNTMPHHNDLEKAHHLADAMRGHIAQATGGLPEDNVLRLIYKTTVIFQEDIDHIWQCLLAAATYYKNEMMPPENDPRNFMRQVFMYEADAEAQGEEPDLYGDFDPTPVYTREDRDDLPAPFQNRPKLIH